MYTNSDQLVNKRDDLCMAIAGREPDIIMITEVIPKAQVLPIAPALLHLPGYYITTSFDPDMPNLGRSRTRGICIYVRDGLHGIQVTFTEPRLTEHIWMQIGLKGTDKLTVGCVYRSPSVDPYLSVEELKELFYMIHAANPSHLLIAGDFNVPQINWSSGLCSAPDSHYAHEFLNVVRDCLLFQHIMHPTRFRNGECPSLLDLVLTNEEGMLTSLSYSSGLGKSDHVTLLFQLACYTSQPESCPTKLSIHRADFKRLNQMLLETDWHELMTDGVEDA